MPNRLQARAQGNSHIVLILFLRHRRMPVNNAHADHIDHQQENGGEANLP